MNVSNAGLTASIPNKPHTTADAGALAHGWLHDRLGFSSLVHASITAVAPTSSIWHQLFSLHEVISCSASAPWSLSML